jgi:HlyD family secretion protein
MTTSTSRFATIFVTTGALALALAAGIYSRATHAADEKPQAAPKPALTVAVTQLQQAQLPVLLSANGNIAAWQETSIGSEAQGLRLVDVRVDVGDRVRAGQVLAVYASDGIQADVAQARAALAEAEVSAQAAGQEAERARAVQDTGAVSAQVINQLLNAELSAKARVQTARAQVLTHQVRLKNTQVLAPDFGVISARTASVGAVGGGDLFRLIRKGRLEWRAEITSAELARVKPGLTVTVTSAAGAKVQGKVRMVSPQVDAQTRAALVYVDLPVTPEVQHLVKPGMFAKGDFELGQSSAVTLPQTAVVVRDGFSYVYTVGADNRVAQVKLQTGRIVGDRVEILGKLAADARVVAIGAGFLNDGDLVRVAPAK